MVKRVLLNLRFFFSMLLFDPLPLIRKWLAIPYFLRNFRLYSKANSSVSLAIKWKDIYYRSYDRYYSAGQVAEHYFLQDIWAAKKIFSFNATNHVDVGSRVDGFVAHLLTHSKVTYIDFRPLPVIVEGLNYREGSILRLPLDNDSCETLSCLHVIEHIGLGRYGDEVNPNGHILAAQELIRVLKPGGDLLIAAPVGHERLCFDAHRIFDPKTVLDMFNKLELTEFSLIDDKGEGILSPATIEMARNCDYGCGLFHFKKPCLTTPE